MYTLDNLFDKLADNIVSAIIKEEKPAPSIRYTKSMAVSSDGMGLTQFIEATLREETLNNPSFAGCSNKTNKSIEECTQYIFGEMFKKCTGSGNVRMAVNDYDNNKDVYAMIVEYYSNDNVKISPVGNVHVQAIKDEHRHAAPKPKNAQKKEAKEGSLFDLFNE